MAAANLDDCCAQICSMLGLAPPELVADESGERAFTITYRGADFSFVQRRRSPEGEVSMLVRFGLPKPEKSAEILANLMGMNYILCEDGLSFAQMPETGEVFLHSAMPLGELHVPGLVAAFDHFAAQVARWNSDYFLQAESPALVGLAAMRRV